MSYWQKLEKRSVFLWRALFGTRSAENGAAPVYIDRSGSTISVLPERKETAAPESNAALQPQKREQPLRQRGGQEKTGASVLAGVEAAEAALRQLMQENNGLEAQNTAASRRRFVPEISFGTENGEETQRKAETVRGGAAKLLAELETMEHTRGRAAAASPRAAAPAGAESVRQNSGAEWSAYFERDARRYDGAHELL